MASTYRHGLESPPKYRRSTLDIYHSLETGQHTPTASALDRKWVHRSVGDLTSENDLQFSHPRLTSKFYQELYQKYPRAFQRRREARDVGRKLFNHKLHVKFDDEIVDDMSLKSYRSERPITNWDREVGHYKNSRSRDCFTSLEPSETGSVLSVKERLHLNSQTLNRLLNEKSPLRKRFSEESNENSPTSENLIRDSLLSNRTRLRFRHRKVLQRRVDNKQNGAVNGHIGELKKPPSYSAQYARRARTVSPTNSKHKHIDVEALLTNADLEIDTLLEKINAKMPGPESPPDSAIDVDTPSLRSLATTERGSNSDLPLSVPQEHCLPDLDANATTSKRCSKTAGLFVDTGGLMDKTKSHADEFILDPLKDPDNILLLKEYDVNFDDIQMPKKLENQRTSSDSHFKSEGNLELPETDKRSEIDILIDDINAATIEVVNGATQSNHDVNSGNGQGMLQLLETNSKHNNIEGPDFQSEMFDIIQPEEYSKNFIPENIANRNDKTEEQCDFNLANEIKNSDIGNGLQQVDAVCNRKQLFPTVADANQDNYQVDDSLDIHDVESKLQSCVGGSMKLPTHRDSDVDSGIGQSGTETRSPLPVPPPRGRSRQRGAGSKTQPIKADHSILPLRSEVDTCILNEVDLTKLSHDISHDHRRHLSHVDMVDDTDPTRESVTFSSSEEKLTEKYRRRRSPSPYVLKSSRTVSPHVRPQSAPLYYSNKLDLCVIDISLSNESLSDISSGVSSTQNDVSVSGIESFIMSNSNNGKSVQNKISCQTELQPSSKSQLSNDLSQLTILKNEDLQTDPCVKSSSPNEQRKSSSSTFSVTSVSSFETVTALDNDHKKGTSNGFDGFEKYGNNLPDHIVHNGNMTNSEHVYVNLEIRNELDINTKHSSPQIKVIKNKVDSELQGSMDDMPISSRQHIGHRESNDTKIISSRQTVNQNMPDNHDITEQTSIPTQHYTVENQRSPNVPVTVDNSRGAEPLGIYSAKKIDIAKPKLETQCSVESKQSFESVELNSDTEPKNTQRHEVREIRRIYKPSVNSPRVNEKKTNMRNILKLKKGKLSPGIEQTMHHTNQNEVVLVGCDKVVPEKLSTQNSANSQAPNSLQNVAPDICVLQSEKLNGTPEIDDNDDIGLNRVSNPIYSAKPVVVIKADTSEHEKNLLSPEGKHLSKLKTNLHAELNLSKYKISSDKRTSSDQSREIRLDQVSQSGSNRWSQDSQTSHESSKSHDSHRLSHVSQKSLDREEEEQAATLAANKQRSRPDDGEIHVLEESNLQRSKGMSASKGSLFEKMGGLKIATKGKLKALRKAMSLERGIDQVGHEPQGQGQTKQPESKGGHSFLPKMKKAPSLKSFAGFFGKKKKKGKFTAEDMEAGASGMTGTGSNLTIDKRKQWASCHTLSSIEAPPDPGGIGRLLKMNPDGTQIVELKRPPTGHLGFFIAQGNPKYKKGVFVSRFSKDGPENMLAGLIGVGDEILEVNRHLVHDLSLDAVYKLMGASSTITLKIFPLIARRDI